MNEFAYFGVKSISLSRLGKRKPCTLEQAARHNLREIQSEKGADGNIDAARSNLNRVPAGPTTAAAVQALAMSMMVAAGVNVKTLRKDHAQALECLFSLPSICPIDENQYFDACLSWLRTALCLPILSATVHRDEGAPHMHVLLLPLRGGDHVGSKPIQRDEWQRLCALFFENVAGPAGLQRPGAKLHGSVKKWAVEAVLHACSDQGLLDALGSFWPFVEASIRRNPGDALKALGMQLESVRPTVGERPKTQCVKPSTGFASNPYGFTESETQCSVGLPPPKSYGFGGAPAAGLPGDLPEKNPVVMALLLRLTKEGRSAFA